MTLPLPLAKSETVEIYFLSRQARFKLIRESNDDSPNLRKLLAHANLVDMLSDELQSRRPRNNRLHFQEPVVSETFQEDGWHCASDDSSDDDSSDDTDSGEDEDDESELIEIGYVEDTVSILGERRMSDVMANISFKPVRVRGAGDSTCDLTL